jgi:hypothetical protein
MEELVLFILTFIFVLIIYEVFIVTPAKRRKMGKGRKKKDKEVVEVLYLMKRYKLDLKKVNYNQLLQIVAITSSLDISIICSLIMLFDNFIIRILVGGLSIVLVLLISYHIVYLFYKKKGMIKNV